MLFADEMLGGSLIWVGALLVGVMFAMRIARSRKRPINPLRDVQKSFAQAQTNPATHISRLEVRLYDFAREVEGRMETRLAILDRLIREADQEIVRLEKLLARSRDSQQAVPAPDIVVLPEEPSRRARDTPSERDAA